MSPARLTDWDHYLRSIPEDDVLNRAMDLFRLHGWLANHVRNSKRAVTQGDTGVPDITAAKAPRLIFAECKREDEALRPDQRLWFEALGGGPAEMYIWRPSDLLNGTIERVIAGV